MHSQEHKVSTVRRWRWRTALTITSIAALLTGAAVTMPAAANADTSTGDWMGALPDSTSLGALSIPGTHDTMTYGITSATKAISTTQSMTLAQQLDAGIRMIDIRVRINTNASDPIQPYQFTIHHGADYTNANFADVLATTASFFAAHPGETVLMRLKAECTGSVGDCSDADHPGLSDDQVLENTLAAYRSDDPNGSILSDASFAGTGAEAMPTLGSVRGRMVLASMQGKNEGVYSNYGLAQFASGDGSGDSNTWTDWDCKWVPSTVSNGCSGKRFSKYVQDEYRVGTIGGIASKRDYVRRFLDQYNVDHRAHTSSMYCNWLNGSGAGAYPSTIANGGGSQQGVEPFALDYLNQGHDVTYTGVMVMDFPSQALISKVISYNDALVS